MRDFLDTFRRLLAGIFGSNIPTEADWRNIPEELLTPREHLMRRSSRVMLVGVVMNLIASVLVFGLAIVAGTQNSALFTSIREVLLTNYLVSDDTAVLLVGAGLLGNMAILLVLVVVIIAQEFWTVIVAIALLVVNGVALFALGFTPSVLTIIPLAIVGAMTLRDLRAFRGNPVTLKELRGRMRGVRGFAIITIFLGLMSFFTILLYLLQVPAGGVVVTGELGRLLFVGILFIELMLIIFIVPALTAGAITTERERKTYDLLQTTLITKSAFVIGKMESALGYIMLLLLSAIPLQSIAFLFGGVSESELILALVVLAVSAITLGAFGMFFSSVTDRTLSATVRSYTVAMMITVGVPIVAFMFFRGAYANVISNVATNLGNNPVTEAAYIYLDMIATSLNPITATIYSQQMLIDHQQLVFMRVTLASNGTTIPVLSPWVLLTVTYLTVTALLVMISIRRMERQGE
jgi:ABC-type transport system involved in multi-copper enzyme maturation permease subunit